VCDAAATISRDDRVAQGLLRQLVRPPFGAAWRAQRSLLVCSPKLPLVAAAAAAAAASLAAACQATACDEAASAAQGLNEYGEVTLEALVGRSLAHRERARPRCPMVAIREPRAV